MAASSAFYNEIEPFAVEWLRRLEQAGHIAPGVVNNTSIKELNHEAVSEATQAHFFAGIGVWSYALRLAGWPDEHPVWTGSCPCQPWSGAGRKGGFADERHLWPDWFKLIEKCRPPVIFGEQVASPDGLRWLDAVSADLEGAGYAFGAADLCAAGVGAPHIRQRLYFVAIAGGQGRFQIGADSRGSGEGSSSAWLEQRPVHGGDGELADNAEPGWLARGWSGKTGDGERSARVESRRLRDVGRVGDPNRQGERRHAGAAFGTKAAVEAAGQQHGRFSHGPLASGENSFWSSADWIPCIDNKVRPVEPGSFPLAHGTPGRVGRLCAYGNAIVPQVAATFIRAVMEIL